MQEMLEIGNSVKEVGILQDPQAVSIIMVLLEQPFKSIK